MPINILVPPIAERFRHHDFSPDFVGIRSGPDRLDCEFFGYSPWPVAAAAYWYHDHEWCQEPQCRCRADQRLRADGLCIVQYEDGEYGWLNLREFYDEDPPTYWNQRDARIGLERLSEIREAGRRRRVPVEAFIGVWQAFDAACQRGVICRDQPIERWVVIQNPLG
jgi:hypothetical protein